MHSKLAQALLAAVVFSAVAWAGCAARRQVAASGPPFRLGAVYGRPVLFSPSIPESSPNSSVVNVAMHALGQPAPSRRDCLVEDGPFRVELAKDHGDFVQIALPSPERWIADIHAVFDPDGDAVKSLYAVLNRIEQQPQDGCFTNESSAIRDFILQSLPVEPNDSLFTYYGYRSSRSGLNLKPGMRLKVERAYLKTVEANEQLQSSQNQEGVSFVYFLVESGNGQKIRFRRAANPRFNPASLRNKFRRTALESELSALPPELQYRLVFYGLNVPTDRKLSASIIGARSPSKLDEFERQLRLRPSEGCEIFTDNQSVSCVDFSGWVTVTPQITIELNGKPKLVDCGTPAKDLLPESALRSLAIQRKFMDSYRDVRFKDGDMNVLSLVLVDGDRLRWTTAAAGGH